jgi:5-methylcytosine-specific restriction endonuclease McrA
MGHRRGTNVDARQFDQETIDKVWDKGKKIPSKNPDLYRRDPAGNEIYKPSYGKDSEKGWQIDHKNPVSKGGTDNLRNLQPLQTDENKEKGSTYPWDPKEK